MLTFAFPTRCMLGVSTLYRGFILLLDTDAVTKRYITNSVHVPLPTWYRRCSLLTAAWKSWMPQQSGPGPGARPPARTHDARPPPQPRSRGGKGRPREPAAPPVPSRRVALEAGRDRWDSGGRRAGPPTTQRQSEPIVNTSCARGPRAADTLQRRAESQDPATSRPPGFDGPATSRGGPRTGTPALGTPLPVPRPAPRPLPGPAPRRRAQAPHLPLCSRGPGGGGATLGRGVASGPHARTRSQALRLRVGPRDAQPESPP